MRLSSEHIAKSFGRKKVLKDVSFKLDAGTLTGIVGENGSGKSVLMEILIGARHANKGTVTSDVVWFHHCCNCSAKWRECRLSGGSRYGDRSRVRKTRDS